jgi:hypothetical protein
LPACVLDPDSLLLDPEPAF